MPDYKNGKIYKIVSVIGDVIYVGSTTQTLSKRLSDHHKIFKQYCEGKYKYLSSFDVLKHGDAKIYLIESHTCNNKKELERREGYYIINNECVNKRVAGRTQKEYSKSDNFLRAQKKYRSSEKFRNTIKAYEALRVICDICGKNIQKRKKRQHYKSEYCKRFRENPFCKSNI